MTVVAGAADLAPGEAGAYVVDGIPIVLVCDEDGAFHALDEMCTHGDISLADGEVYDCSIECWKHGSRFDLLTGRPLSLPATRPVNVYPVTTRGEQVLVDTTAPVPANQK
ncbi:MAG: non-heme iron oxygenase ferredoxin subunit [bacterium]|nr:non-heme iron oxygenase ferredoxin subunit [bacterium]